MLIPKVIYEDDDILALNKPAGLLTHGTSRGGEETLTDWLKKNYPKIERVGEEHGRPGIVHRLDRETSGVLLVAKNQNIFFFLKSQFQNRLVKKVYNALVYGVIEAREGKIDEPIGRNASGRWATTKTASGRLRPAITEFTTLERFANHTFLEARPETGRTHQLRVHFKSIGHPVVCDKLYAPRRPCLPELNRLGLHALSIEVNLPLGGRIKLEADLPTDFSAALHKLRLPC